MNDLSRSNSYYRKLCFIKNEKIPTQTEIRNKFGNKFTNIFFYSCHSILKRYLGLTPVLNGPGDDLWMSPSDLLNGKVCFKPAKTSKHLKCLNYQEIYNLGQFVDTKLKKKFKANKETLIALNEFRMKICKEKAIKDAIEQVRREGEIKEQELVEKYAEIYQTKLRLETEKMENHDKPIREKLVELHKNEVRKQMIHKMKIAIIETAITLTEEFGKELVSQSQDMHQYYWMSVRLEKRKKKTLLESERIEIAKKIENLQISMQCNKISNTLHILQNEHKRHKNEMETLEKNYEQKIKELEEKLKITKQSIERNRKLLADVENRIHSKEAILFEIIKEFKKFADYVLRVVPSNAEYFKNIMNIMTFELIKSTMRSKPQYFVRKKCGKHIVTSEGIFKCPGINEELKPETSEKEEIYYQPSSKSTPSSTSAPSSSESKPEFLFDEDVYVREEFKDLIAEGLVVSKDNPVWNFELKQIMEKRGAAPQESTIRGGQPVLYARERKSIVSVRFSKILDHIPYNEEALVIPSYYSEIKKPRASLDQDMFLYGTSSSLISIDLDSDKTISRLTLARDSLVLTSNKLGLTTSEMKLRVDKAFGPETKSKKVDTFLKTGRRSIDNAPAKKLESVDSTVSLHVDSLELLRTRTKDNLTQFVDKTFENVDKVRRPSKIQQRRLTISTGLQEDKPRRRTVLEPDILEGKKGGVMFYARPSIIENISDVSIHTQRRQSLKEATVFLKDDDNESSEDDMEIPVFDEPTYPEDQYPRFRDIDCDPDAVLHLEVQDEDTIKKINSYVRIFRANPSLQDLFSSAYNH